VTDRSVNLRAFYAQFVTAVGGARHSRIERAFSEVPREPFAGPGPWSVLAIGPWPLQSGERPAYVQTPGDDPAFLYQDTLVALDAERGINIGQPSLHARCLDRLAPKEGNMVLHVGAGAGYYTALLAELVGGTGRVHAYEIDPELATRAARNLAYLPHVELHARSGIGEGLPQADRIYVNAGVGQSSWSWLEALRPGGRLLFPLQPTWRVGGMLLVKRPAVGTAWPARFVARATFIQCEGIPHDEKLDRLLAVAFASPNVEAVRSLRLAGEPDETCWIAGDGWWLSTAASDGT